MPDLVRHPSSAVMPDLIGHPSSAVMPDSIRHPRWLGEGSRVKPGMTELVMPRTTEAVVPCGYVMPDLIRHPRWLGEGSRVKPGMTELVMPRTTEAVVPSGYVMPDLIRHPRWLSDGSRVKPGMTDADKSGMTGLMWAISGCLWVRPRRAGRPGSPCRRLRRLAAHGQCRASSSPTAWPVQAFPTGTSAWPALRR